MKRGSWKNPKQFTYLCSLWQGMCFWISEKEKTSWHLCFVDMAVMRYLFLLITLRLVSIMWKYVISRVNLLIVCSNCMWSICESVILQFSSPTLSPRIRPSFKHSTNVTQVMGLRECLADESDFLVCYLMQTQPYGHNRTFATYHIRITVQMMKHQWTQHETRYTDSCVEFLHAFGLNRELIIATSCFF